MAESELKLDMPCPWCGTSNGVSASRCRQCYQDLKVPAADAEDAPPAPALFEVSRVTAACPSCGKTNFLSGDRCFECNQPMRGPAAAQAARQPRGKRRPFRVEAMAGWIKLAWLLRLASVLYLFWSAIDTSLWLTHTTAGLATQHAAAERYTVHAIFELVRNVCLVTGLWLLTFLHVGRDDGRAG